VNGGPLIGVVVVGQLVRVTETPYAVLSPSLAGPRPIPKTVQGRGDGFISAHLGKLTDQVGHFRFRNAAVVPGPIARDA